LKENYRVTENVIKPCIEDVSCGDGDNHFEVFMLYYGVLRGFKDVSCNIEYKLINRMKKSDYFAVVI
jgi:hypothetical protein